MAGTAGRGKCSRRALACIRSLGVEQLKPPGVRKGLLLLQKNVTRTRVENEVFWVCFFRCQNRQHEHTVGLLDVSGTEKSNHTVGLPRTLFGRPWDFLSPAFPRRIFLVAFFFFFRKSRIMFKIAFFIFAQIFCLQEYLIFVFFVLQESTHQRAGIARSLPHLLAGKQNERNASNS